jgi:hypothetical protein
MNSSSYHLGKLLINLQYSQKFLCGDVGGKGGKTYVKKESLTKWCYQGCAWIKKSFKLMKQEDDNT